MSQEANVEAVHRAIEASARGDLQAVAADFAPDLEIDDQDIPDAGGADSFFEWVARWEESWESSRVEDVELIPVGEDKVLALFRMIVKGKGSGIELSRNDALFVEFRGDKIARIGYYNDQDQARRAAGLRE